MTFYDYYRYRLYGSLSRIQQDFALAYIYGPAQKAGDSAARRLPIPRLPMRTIREIALQEQAVKDVRPALVLYPRNFLYAGEVADGGGTVSEYLTGFARSTRTFDDVVNTIRHAIDNERA